MSFFAKEILRRLLLLGLPVVALGWAACGQTCPPISCPKLEAAIDVATASTVMANGVEVVLTGPVNGAMVCQQSSPTRFRCSWPPTVAVVPGTYSFQVSAPGYETASIQAEVAFRQGVPPACCARDTIEPSAVSIIPFDASV